MTTLEYARYLGQIDQTLFPMNDDDWDDQDIKAYILETISASTFSNFFKEGVSEEEIVNSYREGYESWAKLYQA